MDSRSRRSPESSARLRKRTPLLASLALLAIVALVAACGDDDDAPATTTVATPPPTPATSPTPPDDQADCQFADAAEAAVAASALVITPESFGTAFHTGGGEFVTAQHVVGREQSVLLESEQFTATARVVAIDVVADVALLQADPADLGDVGTLVWFTGERVRAGEFVGTAGYPVDVTGAAAVSRGIVSRVTSAETGLTVIQTDASVNPGNSGGALFNQCGAVVGVVVEKWNEAGVEGVAYATSFDTAQVALAGGIPPSFDPGQVADGVRASFGDGLYEVGVDIVPGEYRNSDSSGFCYWERLSGFRPDADPDSLSGIVIDDVIHNSASFGLQTVVIERTDAGFFSLDCGEWRLVDPGAVTVEGELRSVFDLRAGDCFNEPALGDTVVTLEDVFVVDCDDQHEYEIYAEFDAGARADPYPGDLELEALWLDGCLDRFDAFVGTRYEESRLDLGALYPTRASWNLGDRVVLCYLFDFFGSRLTGSMQGSGE